MEPNDKILPKKKIFAKLVTRINERRRLYQLPVSKLLDQVSFPGITSEIIKLICLLILVFLFWATITPLTEIAVSTGSIMPKGDIPVVQHFTGGVISKVYVKEGDFIRKNQIVVKLEQAQTYANLEQMKNKLLYLQLDEKRLKGLGENDVKRLTLFAKQIDDKKKEYNNINEFKNIFKEELNLLETQRQSWEAQRQVIITQINQLVSQAKQYKDQYEIQKENVELYEEEVKLYQLLRKTAAASRLEFLRAKRNYNDSKNKYIDLNGKHEQAKQSIIETKKRLAELNSKLLASALDDRGNIQSELSEVKSVIKKLTAQYEETVVRSPISGYVKGLKVNPGKAIMPGETIFEIVPKNHEMLVQSEINTRDIGHVKIGDPVQVKVTTYDFSRYGYINGTLTSLSPATFMNEEKEPYYKATIQLEKQSILYKGHHLPLLPGMTVEANIITGKKSLIEYMLKPIRKALNNSFKER